MVRLSTRFAIIGYEVVGLGAFALLLAYLELNEANGNSTATNFAWVFALVGAVLVLVGLESLSLTRRMKTDGAD